MIYQKYCTSSPACDEDVCRCESYTEEEADLEKEQVVIGIDYGLLDNTDDEDLPF